MKHNVFLSLLALALTLGIFASVTQIFAQDGVNDADTTAPGGGTITNTTNNVTSTTTDDGFNLLWLLPLIAIPLLAYLLWPRSRHTNAIEEPYDERYAGAKGGRAESEEYYDEDTGEVVTGKKHKTRDEL